MLRLLSLRLLTVSAWCLLLPASVYADPVTIGFGENAGAFSFTAVGAAINRDVNFTRTLGTSWEIMLLIGEDDNPNPLLDFLTVRVTVRHVTAPHGEAAGINFQFNDGGAVIGTGMFTSAPSTAALNHGGHVDNYEAVLTFSVVSGQITSYRLHVDGKHCIGNDCPALPAEVNIPEPVSMFLLGTGLVGVAIKTRKKLKNRKSG